MTLKDKMAHRQIIGDLMYNTLLLIEYPDIKSADFEEDYSWNCNFKVNISDFNQNNQIYQQG